MYTTLKLENRIKYIEMRLLYSSNCLFFFNYAQFIIKKKNVGESISDCTKEAFRRRRVLFLFFIYLFITKFIVKVEWITTRSERVR